MQSLHAILCPPASLVIKYFILNDDSCRAGCSARNMNGKLGMHSLVTGAIQSRLQLVACCISISFLIIIHDLLIILHRQKILLIMVLINVLVRVVVLVSKVLRGCFLLHEVDRRFTKKQKPVEKMKQPPSSPPSALSATRDGWDKGIARVFKSGSCYSWNKGRWLGCQGSNVVFYAFLSSIMSLVQLKILVSPYFQNQCRRFSPRHCLGRLTPIPADDLLCRSVGTYGIKVFGHKKVKCPCMVLPVSYGHWVCCVGPGCCLFVGRM